MMLGWSDEGSPALRATHADRDELRRVLGLARDEGRLDATEHDRRLEAVRVAKTRADLAATAVDLPAKKGMREWLDDARIRSADRELAAGVLTEGAASGRLTAERYANRSAGLTEADTYARLKRLLHGLPGWPGTDGKRLLPTITERESVAADLSRAVSDGRVAPGEHDALAAEIAAVGTAAELAETARIIARRASYADRAATADRLTEALADGRLDHETREARAERAAAARTTADLAALTGDLTGKARRLSNADRTETAAVLKGALDNGRLDLDEYDARVKAAYAATTLAETRPLLADLIAPPRPPRRGPLDLAFDSVVVNSALLPAPRGLIGRLHPKPLWKLGLLGTLAGWGLTGYALGPPLLGLTIGAGWIPVMLLLVLNNKIAHVGADGVKAREAEALAAIRRELNAHPAIASCETELENTTLKIDFRPHKGHEGVPEAVFAAAERLAWRSRLYPLSTLVVNNTADFGEGGLKPVILGHRRKELEHHHGRRPYGRLPAETG
ncbi:DUF1707 SHOCT-like domain-containing protein [Phytomonospora endophytica]|uniref:DUF1707 domain-containing protein n=1 Tax=Phytomonospora endophytica TaxID=714109 RepID=A0A841FF68_9ACTN|nr:DUF1707 domain-containing protein [Phytomonospora endophytica]MBB6034484.1 hypothetical protein [Phytomonospora endophytica]GIG70391.1 hypothetical protein Pen01_66860 [Phytomonospora endophytica]